MMCRLRSTASAHECPAPECPAARAPGPQRTGGRCGRVFRAYPRIGMIRATLRYTRAALVEGLHRFGHCDRAATRFPLQLIALGEYLVARDPINERGHDQLALAYLHPGRLDEAWQVSVKSSGSLRSSPAASVRSALRRRKLVFGNISRCNDCPNVTGISTSRAQLRKCSKCLRAVARVYRMHAFPTRQVIVMAIVRLYATVVLLAFGVQALAAPA